MSVTQKISAPAIKINSIPKAVFARIAHLLKGREQPIRILIIGGFLGDGKKNNVLVNSISASCQARVTRLDLEPTPQVDLTGNGYTLPFKDGVFELVAACAVIKHLQYPGMFINEVHRVLRINGMVYAECPFLQTYHRQPPDHVRYSLTGFNSLFDRFTRIQSGHNGGPAYTIAELIPLFLGATLSFNNMFLFKTIHFCTAWLLFPIRFMDILLIKSKWADLLAPGNYFLGEKRP